MAGHLSKTVTPSSATSYTVSFWMKLGNLGSSGSPYLWSCGSVSAASAQGLYMDSGTNQLKFYNPGFTSSTCSDGVLRDANAWYHIVWSVNNGSATTYINGVQQSTTNTTVPPLNTHNGTEIGVNYYAGTASSYNDSDCKFAHYHFIDGTAYQASDFGQYDSNGVWKPKTEVSVTYGTNGFFLKFENSGSMGTDSSGNGNNFTVNGTLTQTLDTPSNVYATLNPLYKTVGAGALSNGNLVFDSATSDAGCGSTLAVSKGKWYWEIKGVAGAGTGLNAASAGIIDVDTSIVAANSSGTNILYINSGDAYKATTSLGNFMTFSFNDIIGVGFDADNGDLYYWQNGTALNSGNAIITGIDTTKTWTPLGMAHPGAGTLISQFNFGNGYFGTTAVSSAGSNGNGSIFEYDVPSGYYALNTKNLATYG